MILKVERTMFYTDYYLVEIPNLTDEEVIDEEELQRFIKEEEPDPYYTDEELCCGDINSWTMSEEEAKYVEERSHMKRHVFLVEKGEETDD